MPILFGIRRMRKQLAVMFGLCPTCQRPCAQTLVRIQTWFTLFFLPVFPFSSRYASVCSMCAGTVAVPKAQALQMHANAQTQGAQPGGATPPGPGAIPAQGPVPQPYGQPQHTPVQGSVQASWAPPGVEMTPDGPLTPMPGLSSAPGQPYPPVQ